jgi:hypothetical protein
MAVGLRIKGSHGFVQIDDTYRNLCLVDKGTLPTAATSGTSMYRIDSKYLTDTAILAFSGPGAVCPIEVITSTQTANPYCNVSKLDGACNWWVFNNLAAFSSGVGIRKRNGAGQVIYDSGWAPMRVLGNAKSVSGAGFFQQPSPYDGSPPPSYSQTLGSFDGRTVAVAHCVRAKGETSSNNQSAQNTVPVYAQLGYSSTAGGQAQIMSHIFTIYQASRTAFFSDGLYLLADVTNL